MQVLRLNSKPEVDLYLNLLTQFHVARIYLVRHKPNPNVQLKESGYWTYSTVHQVKGNREREDVSKSGL